MKKLIIWDFDGVIADTEKLWIQSRMELLYKFFGIDWNFDTALKYIGGMSDKDKNIVLNNLGIPTDDNFWIEAANLDKIKFNEGFMLTDYIENIFMNKNFDQCIATGGVYTKTKNKMKVVNIEKYFPDSRVFTIDLVEKGKPDPDLFLLAAKTMNYKPENCIVVEDSIAGLTAAVRANMTPVAFVKYSNDFYINEIKKLGIKNIFDDMRDVETFVISTL